MTTPLSRVVCCLWLGFPNLYTRFEVFISTAYEDMQGNAKRRKRGGFE